MSEHHAARHDDDDDDHDHDHDHGAAQSHAAHAEHDHDHGHDHAHDDHGHGALGWLRELLPFGHGHSHGTATLDPELEGSDRGIWAIKVSLAALGLTTVIQLVIFWFSGSVALLADTLHNFVDAVNGIPLWIALVFSRRAATRQYTYGYARAEDLAGVFIVILILVSALIAGYESIMRFFDPQPLQNLGWVLAAGVVGFVGNEIVAVYEQRVGREIGSAALIADGKHAQVDGLTSLAVVLGALGSLLGYPLLDPIVGLLITLAILLIVRGTAITMWHRLMDAVDPEIPEAIERTAAAVPGVQLVHDVRVRWLGHKLQCELHITVDEDLSTRASHQITEQVRHDLFHAQPFLAIVNVHVDPCGHSGDDAHTLTEHHRARAGRAAESHGAVPRAARQG